MPVVLVSNGRSGKETSTYVLCILLLYDMRLMLCQIASLYLTSEMMR